MAAFNERPDVTNDRYVVVSRQSAFIAYCRKAAIRSADR